MIAHDCYLRIHSILYLGHNEIYVCKSEKENVLGLQGRARKARLEPPGGGGARAHACEWGRAVASAAGTKSPRGASCPSCYEFGFVSARSSQSLHANNVGQSEYKNYQETSFPRIRPGARMNQKW